jgi:EpsD family peptidyl-prolyl cis-trans isomerase
VNDGEITIPQIEHTLQRTPGESNGRDPLAARRILDALVERELATQEARKLGLDRDPRVVQALEAAKREVLARAFQETLAEKATLPSSDEIDRYYDSQPALFAQRRLYTVQDVTVEGTPEQLLRLRDKIESSGQAEKALDVLREAERPFSVRQLAMAPEDVPMALLGRLSQLKDGQSLLIPQPRGARVLTVLESREAPLSREAARDTIRAFLVNERRRQAVQEGMKAVRQAARIEYVGQFAAAASQPASAARLPDGR